MSYEVEDLRLSGRESACPLCEFFLQTWETHVADQASTILVERKESSLKMNGKPVLSVFRSCGLSTSIDDQIPIGSPYLPTTADNTFFDIIRRWLSLCDDSHPTCRTDTFNRGTINSASTRRLPKRIIDVSRPGCSDYMVYLQETDKTQTGDWIALSHQWGDPKLPRFRTTTDNKADHKKGIKLTSLPNTFRDAVKVTRELGCRYLWIDSLCIVQEGSDADFQEQARRMEQVYSDAWCVLAASRRPGHWGGFLEPRLKRSAITLYHENEMFYICQALDNFEDHVLNGALNQRGWVLQEHALARRTVYFTDHQMYFQCGDGVRCETMTKMTNEIASFLGDANFPRSIRSKGQGEKILLYQDLFKLYSRLGLSEPSDRPMAIDSLQRRILASLNVDGGFGILNDQREIGLLRRTLLWCRDRDSPGLERITFPRKRVTAVPPSWSWMALRGAIEYINPPFGEMMWDQNGTLHSPWSKDGFATSEYSVTKGVRRLTLSATAWEYSSKDGESEIISDCSESSVSAATWCIVLGREHGQAQPSVKKHYVLIVASIRDHEADAQGVLGEKEGPGGGKEMDGKMVCERVGAGWLLGRCIHDSQPGFPVIIA